MGYSVIMMTNKKNILLLLTLPILLMGCSSLTSKKGAYDYNNVDTDTSICSIQEIEIIDSSFYQCLDSIILYSEKCISSEVDSEHFYFTLFLDSINNISVRTRLSGARNLIPLNFDNGGFYYKNWLFTVNYLKKHECPFFNKKNSLIYINNCSHGYYLNYFIGDIEFKEENIIYDLRCEEMENVELRRTKE